MMDTPIHSEGVPVSVESTLRLDSPLDTSTLIWIGTGLLTIFALLSLRDLWLARRRWIVPVLLLLRMIACAGILLALSAPSEVTTSSFESRRGLGIYLDTSASMTLQDDIDGEGHLARWRLAATDTSESQEILVLVDAASSRLITSVSLFESLPNGTKADQKQAALKLVQLELKNTVALLHQNAAQLPFEALCTQIEASLESLNETHLTRMLHGLNGKAETVSDSPKLLTQWQDSRALIEENLQKLAAVSRELARRRDERDRRLMAGDSNANPTRFELAAATLRSVENLLVADERSNGIEIERASFSGKTAPATAQWDMSTDTFPDITVSDESNEEPPASAPLTKPLTDLNAALREIASEFRAGRMDSAVLVTDAVHNSEDNPLQIPSGLENFPLLIVPAGASSNVDDVVLWRTTAPKTLMWGDYLTVDCLIGSKGFDGARTAVRLIGDGVELDSKEITFDQNDGDQKIRLTTPVSKTGVRHFDVEVVAMEGERLLENNRESFSVDVFAGDLSVLLIDGWPRWETRYLSNLLSRDKTASHLEILLSPTPPAEALTSLLPLDEIDNFNVIIIGEVDPLFLNEIQIEALEKFVDEGGTLVTIAGREHMPAAYVASALADLLPIRLDQPAPTISIAPGTSYRLAPTPAGERIAALSLEDDKRQNSAVWALGSSRLQLSDFSPWNLPKPSAQVILEALRDGAGAANSTPGSGTPYMVWHRYGAGRVFSFTSPTTYFLRYRFGDRYHYRFWGQFLRWVTVAERQGGNAFLEISSDARRYRELDEPRIEIELRDTENLPLENADISVQLERNGSVIETLPLQPISGSPGEYRVSLPPLLHGEYVARAIGGAVDASRRGKANQDDSDAEDEGENIFSTNFLVVAKIGTEAGDYSCDWDTAHRIAAATGGAVIPPTGLAAAIETLTHESGRRFHQTTSREPLWNRWALFFAILIFLCVEWAGRKYAGLI